MISFLFVGCKKNSIQLNTSETPENWVSKNAGPFKEGIIQIKSSNGSLLKGKLDWDKMKNYTYRNKVYWSIPFLFGAERMISTDGKSSEKLSFNLILRINEKGKFEGAIKTTIYGDILKDISGRESKRNVESYQLINGEESTLWISDIDFRNKVKANRKTITIEQKDSQGAKNGGCEIYQITEYELECEADADYNTTCYFIPYYTYITICQDSEEEDYDGDEWGGGGDTGGGSGDNQPPAGSCDLTEEYAQNLLSGMNEITNIGTSIYSSGAPSAIDGIIKEPRICTWDFFSLNMGFGAIPVYTATFRSVRFKNNTNDSWKWLSFDYDQTSQSRGWTPPCMGISMSNTVSNVISEDKLSANAVCVYSAHVTITCLGNTQVGKTYSNTLNAFFPAGD